MGRRIDIVITVAGCVAAFIIGVVGVTAYAMWDVSRRMR